MILYLVIKYFITNIKSYILFQINLLYNKISNLYLKLLIIFQFFKNINQKKFNKIFIYIYKILNKNFYNFYSKYIVLNEKIVV